MLKEHLRLLRFVRPTGATLMLMFLLTAGPAKAQQQTTGVPGSPSALGHCALLDEAVEIWIRNPLRLRPRFLLAGSQ